MHGSERKSLSANNRCQIEGKGLPVQLESRLHLMGLALAFRCSFDVRNFQPATHKKTTLLRGSFEREALENDHPTLVVISTRVPTPLMSLQV